MPAQVINVKKPVSSSSFLHTSATIRQVCGHMYNAVSPCDVPLKTCQSSTHAFFWRDGIPFIFDYRIPIDPHFFWDACLVF